MKPSKEKSLALLRRSLERLLPVRDLTKYSSEHEKWERSARNAIRFAFGAESQQFKDFESALEPYVSESEIYPISKATKFNRASERLAVLFEGMIEEVEDFWEPDVAVIETGHSLTAGSSLPPDKNIFIIHGHDVGAKEEVARFLSKIGLNPIFLHEQPNKGKTIIEKFEQHATVSYAIALLTPDDIGASNADRENLQPRPRQNVIFEFGYFIGKLGRASVCGLVKAGVEIPSEYSGVLYIPLDADGAWKLKLLRELKAAQLQIDANAAL